MNENDIFNNLSSLFATLITFSSHAPVKYFQIYRNSI